MRPELEIIYQIRVFFDDIESIHLLIVDLFKLDMVNDHDPEYEDDADEKRKC